MSCDDHYRAAIGDPARIVRAAVLVEAERADAGRAWRRERSSETDYWIE